MSREISELKESPKFLGRFVKISKDQKKKLFSVSQMFDIFSQKEYKTLFSILNVKVEWSLRNF